MALVVASTILKELRVIGKTFVLGAVMAYREFTGKNPNRIFTGFRTLAGMYRVLRGQTLAPAIVGEAVSDAALVEVHSEAETTLLHLAKQQRGARPLVLNFGSCS